MKKITQLLFLALIIFLATILRFNQLNSLPALNADEAAIGYNAYSLLRTGKDEHGNPWPIHFQSFNDWKPGLYVYLVMPFVKVFGLDEWSVRIPGATVGVLTVLVVYFLTKELFPSKKWLPEMSALFLAISPWHIHFSRGGWEANVATFFVTLGVFGIIKGIKKTYWWYIAVFLLAASCYTYHAARVIVPLVLLGLIFIYRRYIFQKKVAFFLSFLFGLLIVFPLFGDILSSVGTSRAAGVSIFADPGPFWRANRQRGEHGKPTFVAVLFHNKVVNYSLAFLENYFKHFSAEFLFLSGDEIQRNRVPEMGQMYISQALFLAIATFCLMRNPKDWWLMIIWLLAAPVPAALTFQSPHALRAQNMVVPLTIISAFGAYNLIAWIKHLKFFAIRNFLFIILTAFIFWEFIHYLHQYYVHMAKTYDFSSQYGMKELVDFVRENDKYLKVVVTDRYDQPYILFLFYLRYPPELFQFNHSLTARDQFGFSTVREFDKYVFSSISPLNKTKLKYPAALIVGTGDEIPETENILKTIYFPSGRIAFRIIENR